MLLGREGFILMIFLHVMMGGCFLLLCWMGFRRRYAAQRDLQFLWRSLVVLAILSVVAPPFWGGVFNPGYRILQIALAVGVFLVVPATEGLSRRLVLSTAVLAGICGVVNFAQFTAIQRNVFLSGVLDHEIPERIVTQLTWVAPTTRYEYYEDLTRKVMTKPIFTSALFHASGQANSIP
jgi:hypothetical protein